MEGIGFYLQTVGLATLLVILLIVGYGAYNVFLHPCSAFPGPKLWAAYRLPYVVSTVRGRLPQDVLEAHKKYGPVVRIAPNELSFTEPQAWNDIAGIHKGRRQNRKETFAYSPVNGTEDKQILLAPDAQHARLRRLYAPAFTTRAVEEQSATLLKYANQLITAVKSNIKTTPVLDLNALFNGATFDFTGDFAFDESFHCLERGGKSHFFMELVLDGVIAGLMICQLERYGIWQVLEPVLPKSFFQAKFDLDDYTSALVARRYEKGYVPGKTDVLNYLLQDKDERDHLTRAELHQNSIVLVAAGSDTTATLLSAAAWLLARHPDCYEKAVAEVRSAFDSDEEITPKATNGLEYMQAVLDESLRVLPATPFGFPRIITAKEGQNVAGVHVPHDTRCVVFQWAAYHTPRNFVRPDDFVPERWLPNAPPEFAGDRKDAFHPFAVGPRSCIGKNLAHAESRLLFAKLLWHFDFELEQPGEDWGGKLRAYTIWYRTRLNMRMVPVER